MKKLLVILALLFPLTSFAAVQLDASSSQMYSTTVNTATTSINRTGPNELTLVFVQNPSCTGVSAATLGGSNMTFVASTTASGNRTQYDYSFVGGTGSAVASVTCTGAAAFMSIHAESFTGANQTTPIDATTTRANVGGATFVSSTITTTIANDLIVDFVSTRLQSSTGVGAGQTIIVTDANNTGLTAAYSSYKQATTTQNYTMSWTQSASQSWTDVLVAIEPVANSTVNIDPFVLADDF